MRRLLVISGIAIGVIILIIAGLIGYAVLNLNSIIAGRRGLIMAKVSEAVGRPVEIQDIKAGLGYGVTLEITGLKIGDDPSFSQQPFVQADQVSGEVEFLPLLSREVKVRKLALVKPVVRIIKNDAGKLNVSTIGKKMAQPSATPTPAPVQGGLQTEAGGIAGSLQVTSFAIEDGEIYYADGAQHGAPIHIKHTDLSLDNFSLTSPFDLSLKLAFPGEQQDFSVDGKAGPIFSASWINPSRLPLDFKFTVGPLLLDQMRALAGVGSKIPGKLSMPDPLSLSGGISGTLDTVAFNLATDLTPAAVVYVGMFAKPKGMTFKLTAAGERRGATIALSTVNLMFGKLDLKATGISIANGSLAGQLDTNRFDLGEIAGTLSAAAPWNVSGNAEIHGSLNAAAGTPQFTGMVTLADVATKPEGGKLPAISGLNGNVKLAPNSAAFENTTFAIGGSKITVEAQAQSIKPLRASYTVKSDALRLADLVPGRDPAEQVRQLQASGTAAGEMSSPAVTATVSSAQGTIANVNYNAFELQADWANQQFTARALKLGAFGGSIDGNAKAMLATAPQFNVALNLASIDLQQALQSQKAKAADMVRGQLSGQMNVAGQGAKFDDIKPTLSGSGHAAIKNGKLIGVNVPGQAISKVDNIPGVGTLLNPEIIARHPALFKSPDTDLQNVSLSFTITGPRITSHDITVDATDYRLLGDGWFDMDKNIDLNAQILLSQQFSSELVAQKKNVAYLEDQQGQVAIPLVIRGMLPKPSIQPDVSILAQRAAQRAVTGQLGNLLQKKGLGGLLGGRGGGSSGAGGGASPPPSNNPLAPFKGLFR